MQPSGWWDFGAFLWEAWLSVSWVIHVLDIQERTALFLFLSQLGLLSPWKVLSACPRITWDLLLGKTLRDARWSIFQETFLCYLAGHCTSVL